MTKMNRILNWLDRVTDTTPLWAIYLILLVLSTAVWYLVVRGLGSIASVMMSSQHLN